MPIFKAAQRSAALLGLVLLLLLCCVVCHFLKKARKRVSDHSLSKSISNCISNHLTLFYMGFWRYVNTWGGSKRPPLAKCFLRQPICMEMTQNGSQCKILVFSYPYIPKTAFFDDYFSRERSRKELGY